ncbi:Ppx/GppA phosphatase family protein [Dawidia soli]|uniref:Exopolyphosphatase n=1 Tax=Dawidia soli TaxID=2782352 RepID=A0AAP2D559_9BACT|nr:exopolyphosphatase [Dawidia soli]MBT1685528.1 exopolyphosphatase [Dawidia soli]
MYAKIAIIDMGTNTFHLLMAGADDRGYHILSRDRLAVKIGMGGINEGYITEAGIHRALLAMQSFKNIIDEAGVQKVYAFGTSALRNARNNHEVVARIKALTDLDVDIISGDREAEFIYYGVKSALHLEREKSLIVDIGGGSVEFIIGDNDTIFWKKSLEIGAQRLLEKFHQHDPITPADIQALDVYFDTMLAPLFEALEEYPTRVLVGSSGTFDTLSDIFCIRHEIHKTAEEIETPLSLEGFWEIYDELIHKDRAARMQMPGMIDMRVDMIVVACCLIRYLLERHDFNRIRVSTYSLKEGVLASLIQEMKLLA